MHVLKSYRGIKIIFSLICEREVWQSTELDDDFYMYVCICMYGNQQI